MRRSSVRAIRDTKQWEACIKSKPKDDVTEYLVALDCRDATNCDEWDLAELRRKKLAK